MVGFWFFKYGVEDRSIGVVDYVLLREAEDIKLPVVSLCFENPFLKKELQDLNANATSYLQYLNGHIQKDEYKNIDYQNVTLDLGDYFESAYENWYNETDYRDTSFSFDHIVTFNGFWWELFLKCFSVNIKNKKYNYIKELKLTYNKTKLMNDWSENGDPELKYYLYTLHYPGQFFHGYYWGYSNYLDSSLSLSIQEIEILQRRSSRKKSALMTQRDMTEES